MIIEIQTSESGFVYLNVNHIVAIVPEIGNRRCLVRTSDQKGYQSIETASVILNKIQKISDYMSKK